jgi:hypothetical protein
MRILNQDNGKDEAVKNVLLMLTIEEANELKGEIETLLSRFISGDHSHISDKEYKHEITVALYSDTNIHKFSQRVQRLINEDY